MTRHGLDYTAFEALTFDCYGTLIDWEAGILAGLRAVLAASGADPSDEELLELYGRAEAVAEAGPYRRYREILAGCCREVCVQFGVDPDDASAATFGDSVPRWPAFPDSTDALRRLQARYRLGVITNCDDDLFAASNDRLRVGFDWVITAQSVGSYKPDPRNFEAAFAAIGLPRERILHVAQSLFHDHVPAKALGMSTVWIDRRHDRPGSGATPPATVTPDAVFPDMASFAAAATAPAPGETR
jgi:2-haloalkanoic acid dehalogenase type II